MNKLIIEKYGDTRPLITRIYYDAEGSGLALIEAAGLMKKWADILGFTQLVKTPLKVGVAMGTGSIRDITRWKKGGP